MAKIGFFERRKLEKIAESLPQSGTGYERAKEENQRIAEECGIKLLIRIAEIHDSLPRHKNEKWHSERSYRLYSLCVDGLSHLISLGDLSPLMENLDRVPTRIAERVLVNIGGENVKSAMLNLLTAENDLLRDKVALPVLTQIGDKTLCSDIAELLEDSSARLSAVIALGNLKCAQQVPQIIQVLDGMSLSLDTMRTNNIMVTLVASALKRIGDPRAIDSLLSVAANIPGLITQLIGQCTKAERRSRFDILMHHIWQQIYDVLDALCVYQDPKIRDLFSRINAIPTTQEVRETKNYFLMTLPKIYDLTREYLKEGE